VFCFVCFFVYFFDFYFFWICSCDWFVFILKLGATLEVVIATEASMCKRGSGAIILINLQSGNLHAGIELESE
jgi:hypothetical protein